MKFVSVILDIPTQALDAPYAYAIPSEAEAPVEDASEYSVQVGCAVLVPLGARRAVGFVVGLKECEPEELGIDPARVKPIIRAVSRPYFDEEGAACAQWLSERYIAPLSSCVRLFTPPGGVPRIVRTAHGGWRLEAPAVGEVDDRWVVPGPELDAFEPRKNAVKQQAIIDALRMGEMRVAELSAQLGSISSTLKSLEAKGVLSIEARRRFCAERGVADKDVGCFFITPCAAKMTAIRKPLGHEKSAVDGAISFLEVYGLLSGQIKKAVKPEDAPSPRATSFGIGWARTGGEAGAVQQEESLAVDGIDNVIRVLEEIEDNRLPGLRFFEGMACFGGCIGGPLSFENPFIARNRIRKLVLSLPKVRPQDVVSPEEISGMADEIFCDKPLEPVKVMQLGKDVREALHNMERVEELSKKLPGLDCGSCGSPSCQALAEDIVLGYASEMDCLVLLKERLRQMAHQMVEMSETTRK